MGRKETARLYSRLAVLAGLWVGLVSWSYHSEAAERRCGELRANCVCARSLEANGWAKSGIPGNTYSYNWAETNQDTSDPKLCGYITTEGKRGVYIQADGTPSVTTGLNGRPALLANGLVLTLAPGDDQWISSVARAGRIGIRYYFKLGPGWQTTADGPGFPGPSSCTNDKYTQLGTYFTANNNGFYFEGGGLGFGIAPANVIGDWVRVEHYVHIDANGNPGPHEIYFTNLTKGYTKSATNLPDAVGYGKQALDGFHDVIHKYRADTCAGSISLMYPIMANWPTDAGQRIGPASELEGGTLVGPSAPRTLGLQ